MKNSFLTFAERAQKPILVILDIIAVALAIFISFYGLKGWYKEDVVTLVTHSWSLYVSIIVFILLFWLFRLYKYTWRYAGVDVLTSIVASSALGTMILTLLYKVNRHEILGVAFSFIFVLVFCAICIIRFVARWASIRKNAAIVDIPQSAIKNILVVGNHEDCGMFINNIRNNPQLAYYNIVGIIDNDPMYTGKYVGTIRVFGTCAKLNKLVESNDIQEVFFILNDDFNGEEIKPYVLDLRRKRIPVKTINNLSDAITGKQRISLQDINVEDVLHRPARKIDLKVYGDYIKDRVVLVTGGGGSIGSEIVRQVSALEPKQLVILGHGENSIFNIYHEIKGKFPELDIYPVIASIADRVRIFNTFEKFKPQVVFHAAAHKHVPLMELNIHEAVRNNVCGTLNLADACYEYGVETFVQISTDKAADPSSVMGATKFVCEQVVKSVAKREGNKTKFVIVRFGNVLGSRGSVIPVFLKQIANGGPVTVTDPQMTRFFMIIPEACRLVIQSGSIGENGHIYVLDMGKPVKIMDLAEDIISICGYTPGKDMEIKISGIRNGEKLHEVLSSETENLQPTSYQGINTVDSSEVVEYSKLCEFVNSLNSLEKTKDAKTFIYEVNTLKK